MVNVVNEKCLAPTTTKKTREKKNNEINGFIQFNGSIFVKSAQTSVQMMMAPRMETSLALDQWEYNERKPHGKCIIKCFPFCSEWVARIKVNVLDSLIFKSISVLWVCTGKSHESAAIVRRFVWNVRYKL